MSDIAPLDPVHIAHTATASPLTRGDLVRTRHAMSEFREAPIEKKR